MFILANLVVPSLILIHLCVLTISVQAVFFGWTYSTVGQVSILCTQANNELVFFSICLFPPSLQMTQESGWTVCPAVSAERLSSLFSNPLTNQTALELCTIFEFWSLWYKCLSIFKTAKLVASDIRSNFRFHLIYCLLIIAQFTINETDVSWNILWWPYLHHDSFLLSWLTCYTVFPLVKHPS